MMPVYQPRGYERRSARRAVRDIGPVSTSAANLQRHGQMIKTTTFAAPGAVDKVLERLRFSHGAEQHDGLAGRASRHGGIRTIPDDPDGARPFPASAPDIVVRFGLCASQATLP